MFFIFKYPVLGTYYSTQNWYSGCLVDLAPFPLMVDVHLPPMANALLFRCTPILLVCTISAILSWYNIPRSGTGTGVIPALAFVGHGMAPCPLV